MSDERPFTNQEIMREYGRFHMFCTGCGQTAVPTLMPEDSILLVRLFLAQHKACPKGQPT
jgi:hypothetical protein